MSQDGAELYAKIKMQFVERFANSRKHAPGMLRQAMVVAYEQAINDVFEWMQKIEATAQKHEKKDPGPVSNFKESQAFEADSPAGPFVEVKK